MSAATPSAANGRPIPVVLDVDTGVDDALALLLAVRHPALDVLAVSCAGGNVPLAQVVENTRRVLDLADAPPVPIAAGMHRPLVETPQDASYVHGRTGLGTLELPPSERPVEEVHAVELLRRTLLAAPEPVTVIALAPLTNVAVLLRMHPEVAPRIARIVMMGGAIGAGNATAAAEFNVWHDPEAAEIVLTSGVPVVMYGLEPFYTATVGADRIAELGRSADPVARAAGSLLAHLAGVTEDEDRVGSAGAAAIGDAGTVAAVIDPALLRLHRAPVRVALAEGPTRGCTVVDLRTGLGAGGAETKDAGSHVEVVTGLDGARCAGLFLAAIDPGAAVPAR
ncbi:nucleoside hydrolase [Agromyces mediolanus]|uniref:nucleoside hydrolase n=1 Tax=Agromyces mediolanus TaxID=41986 RepID=UPI003839166F